MKFPGSRIAFSTTWIIIFCVSLGVSLGFAIASVWFHPGDDPDTGDWLAATGAMIGIVASIATAVWIEDRKRSADRRADLAMMVDALAALKDALRRQCEPLPASDTMAGVKIVTDHKALVEALETLVFVRQQVRPSDVLLWRRVRQIERQVQDVGVAMTADATTQERLSRPDRQLQDDRDALKKMALLTLPLVGLTIEDALRSL